MREVVSVLHADNVGDLECCQELPVGYVADPDSVDQAFVPRSYQRAELVDEPLIRYRVVQHAQIYCIEKAPGSIEELYSGHNAGKLIIRV